MVRQTQHTKLTTKMSVDNKLSPHIPSDMSSSRLDVNSELRCCTTCASTAVRCDTDSMQENTHAVE